MKPSDDVARVRHMLDAATEARDFLGTTTLDELRANRILSNAIIRSLEIVGEAASQVSKDFRDKFPEIEWPVIIGMRNRLVHAYFDIDYYVVWQTIRENIPPLIEQLTKILNMQTE